MAISEQEICDNYKEVCERIESAVRKTGAEKQVKILVVSKTWQAEILQVLIDLGHSEFGENKVQELLKKKSQLPAKIRWHLIGNLQSNKVRKVLPNVELIHSVGSLKLAEKVSEVASELGIFPRLLLQVNLAEEATKSGFFRYELINQMEYLLALDKIEIEGLMLMPPFNSDPEKTRPHFEECRNYRDELEEKFGVKLQTLSMGMSHDYEVAIAEGATVVRVGSAIFGSR